ncbi:hypothetical protein [Candidatus Williamhamiltonella defendens]|nr:hypothetical protein [Candidatus Hamiltonella defensa]
MSKSLLPLFLDHEELNESYLAKSRRDIFNIHTHSSFINQAGLGINST